MEPSQIYDISPIISPSIAVWPGDKSFERHVSMSITAGDNLELSSIATTVHLGAHADAPSHYAAQGKTIEQLDLWPYIGLCQVISVDAPELIHPDHFRDQLDLQMQRVLFKTSSFPDPDKFNEDFTAFSPEAIDYLAAHGVKLVGIDTPSVDPFSSKELPTHLRLLRHDMRNLEGLVLDHVPDGFYELIALPLRIAAADASPVRAILRSHN